MGGDRQKKGDEGGSGDKYINLHYTKYLLAFHEYKSQICDPSNT